MPLHETKNDLPGQTREIMVRLLNARLADVVDLTTQAKQAHWNVKGPSFIALHELFDQVHADAQAYTDLIGERAVQLGGTAEGTAAAAAQRSTLPSYPLDIVEGPAHVEALSTALAAFGKQVRAAIEQAADAGDQDTADIFTEISRGIDKHLWFVEAHRHGAR